MCVCVCVSVMYNNTLVVLPDRPLTANKQVVSHDMYGGILIVLLFAIVIVLIGIKYQILRCVSNLQRRNG